MSDKLSQIFKSKYYTITTTVIAIFVFAWSIGLKNVYQEKIKLDQKYQLGKPIKLVNHNLFSYLKKEIINIENERWINDYKTAVGRDLIKIKYNEGYKYFYEYAKWVDENPSLSHQKAKNEFYNVIEKLIYSYTQKWYEEGIDSIIISDFNNYHNNNIQAVFESADIHFSHKYLSIHSSVENVLDCIWTAYIFTNAHSKKIINEANGRLVGDVYKGHVNDGRHIIYDYNLDYNIKQTKENIISYLHKNKE